MFHWTELTNGKNGLFVQNTQWLTNISDIIIVLLSVLSLGLILKTAWWKFMRHMWSRRLFAFTIFHWKLYWMGWWCSFFSRSFFVLFLFFCFWHYRKLFAVWHCSFLVGIHINSYDGRSGDTVFRSWRPNLIFHEKSCAISSGIRKFMYLGFFSAGAVYFNHWMTRYTEKWRLETRCCIGWVPLFCYFAHVIQIEIFRVVCQILQILFFNKSNIWSKNVDRWIWTRT